MLLGCWVRLPGEYKGKEKNTPRLGVVLVTPSGIMRMHNIGHHEILVALIRRPAPCANDKSNSDVSLHGFPEIFKQDFRPLIAG